MPKLIWASLTIPAVTVPFSFTNAGLNLAKVSRLVSGLGCSSLDTVVTCPLLALTSTGTIS